MVTFEVFQGKNGDYYWRLKAANGEIVCGSEGYSSKSAAMDSIQWIKDNAPGAEVTEEA